MSNDIVESTVENIYDKITSPLWGTFILTWIIWNWKLVYTTFFIDGDKIYEKYEILKIEYILNKIYDGTYYYFTLPITADYIFYWFIGPILSTIFIITVISPLSSEVYCYMLKDKKKKIIAKESMENDIIQDRTRFVKNEETLIDEKIKLENKKEELEDTRYREWNEEYNKLIKKEPKLFINLKNLLIKYKGNSHSWTGPQGRIRNIPQNIEEILVFTNLVNERERGEDSKYITYETTEKGKYFLNKDTLEN